ncbi:MAG TPA: asparagine synthase-related protein [Magnetospirillum sp.]|nr:asparagine synthase-related protein [Magnetospirillum sp.]
MRLICGLIRLDGAPADRHIVAAMAAAMTEPGLTPRVTLQYDGPAALAVLDFAAPADGGGGALPMAGDGSWLAADLRLDRPGDLAAALAVPDDATPEALALGAVQRWDMDVADRLDGDFALACWQPGRRRLLLARDIMGSRPLCWTHRPGVMVAFASLPCGLHGAGVAQRRLDPLALGRLMLEQAMGRDVTPFADVHWLPPGHALAATPDGVRLHNGWRPDPAQVGRWRGSAQEAAERLRALVDDAVAARLPAAGPVAAHLSGGLDSSAVAVLAARRLRPQGRRLYVFSQLPHPDRADGLCDERDFVRAVLEQEPGMAWTPFHPDGACVDFGRRAPDPSVDAPFTDVDEAICAAAAAAGTHLLLSGAGGDEAATFNGANLHAAMLRHGRWRALPRELRARSRHHGQSLGATVAHRLVAPFLPQWVRQARRRLLGLPSPLPRAAQLDFLRPHLAAKVAAALWPGVDDAHSPQGRIGNLANPYLAGRATRWAALGARHGIAFAYPLMDRRIIDFILTLPLERFARDGLTRQPFRDAMVGVLPELVRLRATKYIPYPDLPLVLAASKPALLAQLAALRAEPAAAEHFDLDAIATALAAIPEGSAAEAMARILNVGPSAALFIRGMAAVRALALAGHAARLA